MSILLAIVDFTLGYYVLFFALDKVYPETTRTYMSLIITCLMFLINALYIVRTIT